MELLYPNDYNKDSYGAPVEKKVLSRETQYFLRNGALKGERNTKMFNACSDMAGCGYSKGEVLERMSLIGLSMGLDEMEIDNVVEHAFSKKRTPSVPDWIQDDIAANKTGIAARINVEEQLIIENTILVTMLMNNETIGMVEDLLVSDDFLSPKNAQIYLAILKVNSKDMAVDYITVADELTKSQLTKITLDDLLEIKDKVYVNSDNILSYANIIRERSAIKKLESKLSNKETYLSKPSFIEMITSLEKDVADIALYGGARTTSILSAKQAVDVMNERMRLISTGKIEQVKTGFLGYDNEVGGIFNNEFIICAGRAGCGKSSLTLSILNNLSIVQQVPTALFSLEMSTHENVSRLVSQLTGLRYKDIQAARLSEQEWEIYKEATDRIAKSPLYFDETYGINIMELRSKIRRIADKGVKLIVIDQLEMINGYEHLAPHLRLDRISYDIKDMTAEFQIPIILNHQQNRALTDRKLQNVEPESFDLNQAGEKAAYQVWFIVHKMEDGKIIKSKVKVAKNRNGPTFSFLVLFLADRVLFTNPARPDQKPFYGSDKNYEYIGVRVDDDEDEEPF